jgi:hypothetical protein
VTLLLLAYLAPNSYWTTMLHKCLASEKRASFSLAERRMLDAIPKPGPPPPPFVVLRDTGHMASTRVYGGCPVKLFIPGNRAAKPHSHEHEDRGSFVLEFAGEAFAMDPGICEYEDPLHALLKQCQYHNMLVPVGMPERAHPDQPILADVKAVGEGDEKSFQARLNATPGWHAYYKQWIRSWDSPAPDTLIVRDEYQLAKGTGVEFYWQTALPCRILGHTVTIQGHRGSAILEPSPDCSIRIDQMPAPEPATQNRIVFRKEAPGGALEVTVRLVLANDGARPGPERESAH